MRLMKKLLTILFAFMMVLATTTMVFADEEGTSATKDGTITITNVIDGQEYKVYQVLELESFYQLTSGDGRYAYKLAEGWDNFLSETGVSDYIEKDSEGYIKWKNASTEEATVAEFAKLALKYVKDNSTTIQTINAKVSTVSVTTDTTAKTIKYTNLPLGYYLVESSTGALCSLNTTNKAVEIKEKNAVPTMTKKIIVNSTEVDDNNVEIGDTVNFEVKITAKKGAQNYVLHDTMGAGFTWNGTVTVKLLKNGTTGAATAVEASKYDLVTTTTSTSTSDGCTFEIKFKDEFLNTLENDDQIIVSYSATLNKNATITTQTATTGNDNKAWLTYGTRTENKTTEEATTTKTFEFNVFKFTGTNTPLANVTFTLARKEDGAEPVELEKDTTTNTYHVKSTGTTATEIKTDDTGKFTVKGLKAGKYYLIEKDAPKGYNKLSKPVEIIIGEDGSVTLATTASQLTKIDGGEIKIENKTGTVLPSTGGAGTTMMYIVGAVLLIGSGVVLITKKNVK